SGGFRMKKIEAAAEIRAVPDGRWSWTSGAGLSSRRFSNEFTGGNQLKYSGSVTRTLVREAATRLTVDTTVTGEAGKVFDVNPIRFAKLESATSFRWRSFTSAVRFGNAIGQIPFDERFTIGLDRDSDLWLRAHRATVD